MSIDSTVSTVRNNYIFVAYYTKQTGYEAVARTLRASLEKFKVAMFIDGIPTRGSWQSNIAYKPEFVFAMMCKYPDRDIIYVDADAELKQYPTYFDTFSGDVGVHFKDGKELLSGTIYFRNNERVRDLVRQWMSTQQHYPNTWDQVTLHRTIGKYAKEFGVKVVDIPAAYTQIFDSMKHNGAPVIEHHQASRKLKTLVDRTEVTCYPAVANIRKFADGTFGIPRRNATIEGIIDKDFVRFPNEPRWYPAHPCGNKFECLRPIFSGKPCYIIGKGPSLDRLTADYFDRTSPILAVNESIHKIESFDLPNPIFMMQIGRASCRERV